MMNTTSTRTFFDLSFRTTNSQYLYAISHDVFTRGVCLEPFSPNSLVKEIEICLKAELTMPIHQDSIVNPRQIDNRPFFRLDINILFESKIACRAWKQTQAQLTQTPVQIPKNPQPVDKSSSSSSAITKLPMSKVPTMMCTMARILAILATYWLNFPPCLKT